MVWTLSDDDPQPFTIVRKDGTSPFFFTGDHAGCAVPSALCSLGLPASELERHIGVDIGIARVGELLSDNLDATFLSQPYSRLVIDCNRPKGQADSIPAISDRTQVPGNQDLSARERLTRENTIFDRYHQCFSALLDARDARGQQTVLVALHSFTPTHGDFPEPRPWHISILYNRDARLARPLIARLGDEADLVVGDNVPYVVSDELDYGIPVHGEARGILSVEIEIRQDILTNEVSCRGWADRLARLLPLALEDFENSKAMI